MDVFYYQQQSLKEFNKNKKYIVKDAQSQKGYYFQKICNVGRYIIAYHFVIRKIKNHLINCRRDIFL